MKFTLWISKNAKHKRKIEILKLRLVETNIKNVNLMLRYFADSYYQYYQYY